MLNSQCVRLVCSALLLVLFGAASVSAQDGLSVASFLPLSSDMTARTIAPERDANGDLTALIKVVTSEQGFDFDGGSLGIVKVLPETGEIWVYVPDRARSITIRHGKLGVLRNYAYPEPVRGGNVYELKLNHGTVEVVVKPHEIVTEWFVVSSTPPGADVYLNDQAVGKTPFSAELPEGRYTWRVERNLYQPEAGVAELIANQRVALDVDLKPNFGRLDVFSSPDEGAKVLLNGIDVGKTTPCWWDELPAGEYNLTLSHEWFETTQYKVDLKAGDQAFVEVPMKPTFGELELTEAEGTRFFINDRETQAGVIRLAPGVYTVEARKPAHGNARVQVVVERNKRQTPELNPQPLYGRLRVQSQPFGAQIEVDGELVGETPFTMRELLIGEHTVTVRKDGFSAYTERVQVSESSTTDLNVNLVSKNEGSTAGVISEATGRQEVNDVSNPEETKADRGDSRALTAERIIFDYYAAIGGRDKLVAVETYTEEARLEMPSTGITLTYSKQLKMPDKLRLSSDFGYGTSVQVVNGNRGIINMSGNATPLDQSTLQALKNQLNLDAFAPVLAHPEDIVFVGEREVAEVVYNSIEVRDASGVRTVYHFDQDSHLLDVIESNLVDGDDSSRTTTWITEYKTVGGLKFPSRLEVDSSSGPMYYNFTRIDVNSPLSDGLFELR